ncbi:MAG: response regulator [Anaerolineae bacterium]|nr:response regulator [Anaerolineae bacterium]
MAPCVLYIEDNIDNLVLVRRVLKAEGIELLEATSAREGIRLAEEKLPDLILMDINMPEMDGLVATAHLRSNPKLAKTPIVALTANIMRDVLNAALDAGCDGCIAKPIRIDDFPEQVLSYLKNGRTT